MQLELKEPTHPKRAGGREGARRPVAGAGPAAARFAATFEERADAVPAAPAGDVMAGWPRFVLVVEVRPPRLREGMPPPPDPVLRLKAVLKTLLRVYSIVAVSVEEAPPEGGNAGGG